MLEILGERRKSDFRSISFLFFTSIMEQNKKRGPKMNILLIYAYPNHNSLNHTIKEK